ncbi:GNAT family N-acetyltransferase, partial [Saccharothrix sp. MB29]|nr:GNAT family N-acetyltransferase [Saccharothrix sp. MB29]
TSPTSVPPTSTAYWYQPIPAGSSAETSRTNSSACATEIGYTMAREHQRRGYAAEAVGRLVEHLFTDRGLHRVTAECDARNDRSARLLTRLGFRREGHRVKATWHKGEWTDDLLFALLAEEWRGKNT